jgi:hypothetical protein
MDETRRALRSTYEIDGCAVEQVLDEVYRSCWNDVACRGLDLRPQVIAWDPLWVAADRSALSRILSTAVKHVVSNTEDGAVHVRAFPSHDEVCVVFEVQNERPARRHSDRLAAFTAMMERARLQVESMGGDVAEFATEDGGSRVCFRLPQWVC